MVRYSSFFLVCSLGRGSRLRTIVSLRIPSRVPFSLDSPGIVRPEQFGRRDRITQRYYSYLLLLHTLQRCY